jgi:mycofactocin precursor
VLLERRVAEGSPDAPSPQRCPMTVTEPTTETDAEPVEEQEQVAEELVTDEVLVEEISIDGMCGVY